MDSQHRADFSDRDVVRCHVANYWRFFTRYIVELTALRQAALTNTAFGAQLEALTEKNVDHLRDHLAPITKAGRTLPGPPELVLPMFASLLDGFRYRWEHSDGRFDGRRVDEDEAIDPAPPRSRSPLAAYARFLGVTTELLTHRR